ncbi:MAG: hypothetical protein KAJ12_12875 [Bacteroidetes bacterium]|nr:hypothetical protein [Bacteroidota bacterium]
MTENILFYSDCRMLSKPFRIISLFMLPLCVQMVHAQGESERLLPEGLGFSNHLEYAYDWEKKIEILENWLNLDYRHRIFSAGLRFEVFQPNDPNPAIHRGKEKYADIAFKYIGAEVGSHDEGADLTVGNYYVLFGRGMVVRLWEDRVLRVDNNLLGLKMGGRYAGFNLRALSGSIENSVAERIDLLHAVDLEYRGPRWLRAGGTFALNQPEDETASPTRMASVRLQPSIWNFDFYGEYAIKQNNDIKQSVFGGEENIVGQGIYLNANFFLGSFSLSAEYKLYDNIAFLTSDRTAFYNAPPAVQRDYSYILLNRHPMSLDPNNEEGYQVEANYNIGDATGFIVSYSHTKSLGSDSYYQRIIGSQNEPQDLLHDAYGQAEHMWGDALLTRLAFGYREERVTNTKSLTPILETRIDLGRRHALRVILEHQQVIDRTTHEQYLDDVLVLELTRSPNLSLSLVGELETREPEAGKTERKYWLFGSLGFRIGDHTDASVLVGSRQAGNICIGGVCRYEPELRGVELRLLTRF